MSGLRDVSSSLALCDTSVDFKGGRYLVMLHF